MSNEYFSERLKNAKEKLNNSDVQSENSDFTFKIENDVNIRNVPLDSLENAPNEWNFYRPLSDNKMEELIESIKRNDILNPIIVWELDNNPANPKYMILSGHNRKKAYEVLREINGNNEYDKIPALIKYKDEITEDEAREIIIDTNWVQRTLSTLEKTKSIIEKYAVLQSKSNNWSKYNNYGEGRYSKIIGKDLAMSSRQVERYKSLQNLIKEIQEMVFNEVIKLNDGFNLAKVDKDIQYWILQNHKDKLEKEYTSKLRANMKLEVVKEIFNSEKKEEVGTLAIDIPLNILNAYKSLSEDDKKLIMQNCIIQISELSTLVH